MEKMLIINADDFGHTKSVSRGIADGFSKGVITSTSLMVNSEFAGHAADLAVRKGMDAGIHLNCVQFAPLASQKRVSLLLNKDGSFKSVLKIGRLVSFNSEAKKQLAIEFELQVKKAIGLGIRLTHLDTHHWSSMFPAVNEIVLRLARKYKINKARCAVESFRWPLFFGFKSVSLPQTYTQFLKHCLISSLSSVSRSQFLKYKIKTTDHYCGIMQTSSKEPLEYFISMARTLKPGSTELMVHPGYYSKELADRSWYTKHRELELKALMSPKLKKVIKEEKIRLIGWKEL